MISPECFSSHSFLSHESLAKEFKMMVGGWAGHWHVVESGYGGTRTKVSRVSDGIQGLKAVYSSYIVSMTIVFNLHPSLL